MSPKAARITGWVLTILLEVLLIGMSAMGKFTDWPQKEEMFGKMGFTVAQMYPIGVLEVAIALLFLIPQTSFLAAILLTGYLGGATVTHYRVGEPVFMPVIVGIVVWIALGLRKRGVFEMAFGCTPVASPKET